MSAIVRTVEEDSVPRVYEFELLAYHFRSGGTAEGNCRIPRTRSRSPDGAPHHRTCSASWFMPRRCVCPAWGRRRGGERVSLEKVKWITRRGRGKINALSCVWSKCEWMLLPKLLRMYFMYSFCKCKALLI